MLLRQPLEEARVERAERAQVEREHVFRRELHDDDGVVLSRRREQQRAHTCDLQRGVRVERLQHRESRHRLALARLRVARVGGCRRALSRRGGVRVCVCGDGAGRGAVPCGFLLGGGAGGGFAALAALPVHPAVSPHLFVRRRRRRLQRLRGGGAAAAAAPARPALDPQPETPHRAGSSASRVQLDQPSEVRLGVPPAAGAGAAPLALPQGTGARVRPAAPYAAHPEPGAHDAHVLVHPPHVRPRPPCRRRGLRRVGPAARCRGVRVRPAAAAAEGEQTVDFGPLVLVR
jgi:hypothetical protein